MLRDNVMLGLHGCCGRAMSTVLTAAAWRRVLVRVCCCVLLT
jgi:hypothetical protein